MQNSQRWWRYFWATIVVLFIVYVGIMIKGYLNTPLSKKVVLENVIEKVQKHNPQILQLLDALNSNTKKKIEKIIETKVNELYEPVYDHIDEFTNFHYSLKGEYSELLLTLTNKLNNFIFNHLFKPTHFDENYKKMMKELDTSITNLLAIQMQQFKENLETMDIFPKESEALLTKILHYSQQDMINRFLSLKYNALKGLGIASMGTVGALGVKLLGKKIAKKIMLKAGVKISTKTASTIGGAAVGAESGLFCGPVAFLCSPIGAVIIGAIGWIASDKVIIGIDKFFHAEDFKKEIEQMLTEQKYQLIKTLKYVYIGSIDKVNANLSRSIESLKNKKIKEIISQ